MLECISLSKGKLGNKKGLSGSEKLKMTLSFWLFRVLCKPCMMVVGAIALELRMLFS